jgi:hypothetical protein
MKRPPAGCRGLWHRVALDGPEATFRRQDLFERDRPADSCVASVAHPRLDGQVEGAGFVDRA